MKGLRRTPDVHAFTSPHEPRDSFVLCTSYSSEYTNNHSHHLVSHANKQLFKPSMSNPSKSSCTPGMPKWKSATIIQLKLIQHQSKAPSMTQELVGVSYIGVKYVLIESSNQENVRKK